MANLKITQTRSLIGRPEKHRKIMRGLGLRKIRHSVVRPDSPEVRGMIFKVKHLIDVEPTDESISVSWRKSKAAAATEE